MRAPQGLGEIAIPAKALWWERQAGSAAPKKTSCVAGEQSARRGWSCRGGWLSLVDLVGILIFM